MLNIWLICYRYPGITGSKGEQGNAGAVGEPGDSSQYTATNKGERGIKGIPGEKGVMYNIQYDTTFYNYNSNFYFKVNMDWRDKRE